MSGIFAPLVNKRKPTEPRKIYFLLSLLITSPQVTRKNVPNPINCHWRHHNAIVPQSNDFDKKSPFNTVHVGRLKYSITENRIKKINKISKIREKNFKSYLQTIKPTFWKPQIDDGNFVSSMGYPIISKNRDNILKILKKYKIDTRPIICGSIAKQPFYYKKF